MTASAVPELRGCEGCGKWIAADGPARCTACSADKPPARSARTRGRKGQAMRAAVLTRDGYRCQWPGCVETAATCDLEAHHVIPIEDAPHLAGVLSNQITLCGARRGTGAPTPMHHLQAAREYRAAN